MITPSWIGSYNKVTKFTLHLQLITALAPTPPPGTSCSSWAAGEGEAAEALHLSGKEAKAQGKAPSFYVWGACSGF